MSIPDTSNTERMAYIGRLAVLRKARREAAQKLRDKLVGLLNSFEDKEKAWCVVGVADLLTEIEELNTAIAELEKV